MLPSPGFEADCNTDALTNQLAKRAASQRRDPVQIGRGLVCTVVEDMEMWPLLAEQAPLNGEYVRNPGPRTIPETRTRLCPESRSTRVARTITRRPPADLRARSACTRETLGYRLNPWYSGGTSSPRNSKDRPVMDRIPARMPSGTP